MTKKQIIILGAGISGLSAAWYLTKTGELPNIVILEKSSRAGGWIDTDDALGYHFEKGPRAFKADKCQAILSLISDLGIGEEMVWSQIHSQHRYLWCNNRLQRIPAHPVSFLFSPWAKGFVRALLTEWRQPCKLGDETVWDFVLRRFNRDVARCFFDPMVVGIFGGDMRTISVRACFPKLKQWEEEYGSVTKGFLCGMTKEKRAPSAAIFSFRTGVQQLPKAILEKIPATIQYNQCVKAIQFVQKRVVVHTDTQSFCGDDLFCALPVQETGLLLQSHSRTIAKELLATPSKGISVVNCGYDTPVLPVQGYGYLTSTDAQEAILGVVFDSTIFPTHNRNSQETRLTIKLAESNSSEQQCVEIALEGLRRHLKISKMPQQISCKMATQCIPQYYVGHIEKMASIQRHLREQFPNCYLLGNYLQGVGVDPCILRAKEAASEWQNALSRQTDHDSRIGCTH